MKTFRDLLIWQKSMALVTNCYSISGNFPNGEQFGLTSQIRRCCVSIPSNISEGFGRGTNKDYHRFLTISLGSLFEFQTQIEIAYNLKYITEENFKKNISRQQGTRENVNFFHQQNKKNFVTLSL